MADKIIVEYGTDNSALIKALDEVIAKNSELEKKINQLSGKTIPEFQKVQAAAYGIDNITKYIAALDEQQAHVNTLIDQLIKLQGALKSYSVAGQTQSKEFKTLKQQELELINQINAASNKVNNTNSQGAKNFSKNIDITKSAVKGLVNEINSIGRAFASIASGFVFGAIIAGITALGAAIIGLGKASETAEQKAERLKLELEAQARVGEINNNTLNAYRDALIQAGQKNLDLENATNQANEALRLQLKRIEEINNFGRIQLTPEQIADRLKGGADRATISLTELKDALAELNRQVSNFNVDRPEFDLDAQMAGNLGLSEEGLKIRAEGRKEELAAIQQNIKLIEQEISARTENQKVIKDTGKEINKLVDIQKLNEQYFKDNPLPFTPSDSELELGLLRLQNSFDQQLISQQDYDTASFLLRNKSLQEQLALYPEFTIQYEQILAQLLALDKEYFKSQSKLQQDELEKGRIALIAQGLIAGDVQRDITNNTEEETKNREEIQKLALDTTQQLANAAFEIARNGAQKTLDYELETYQRQLDGKRITQKEFDRLVAASRNRQAQAEHDLAIFQVIINTAAGIAKALPNIPLAVAAGLLGGAQIAIIASEPVPQFAKGKIGIQGPGTETSDSIHAKLSRGESVITAEKTKKYRAELMALHNGNFEEMIYQNYVLPELFKVRVQMEKQSFNVNARLDDSRIVRAINGGNKEPNYNKMAEAMLQSQRSSNRRYWA